MIPIIAITTNNSVKVRAVKLPGLSWVGKGKRRCEFHFIVGGVGGFQAGGTHLGWNYMVTFLESQMVC